MLLKNKALINAWSLYLLPLQSHLTGIRIIKTSNNPQQSAFTAATWTYHCNKFAFLNLKINILQRFDFASIKFFI
ncbi:hypothetical protein D3C78_701590 [compost metagenome]